MDSDKDLSQSSSSFRSSPSNLRHVQREKVRKLELAVEQTRSLPWTAKERADFALLEQKAQKYARSASEGLLLSGSDLQSLSQATMCLQIECDTYDEQIQLLGRIANRVELLRM